MQIDHIGIYAQDLEKLKAFYESFLGARTGNLYQNPKTGFSSYFLSFAGGARLELMHRPGLLQPLPDPTRPSAGFAHLSLSTGSREAVEALTARLVAAGCPLLDGPRQTGDGYYESVLLDPEGNHIEILAWPCPPAG